MDMSYLATFFAGLLLGILTAWFFLRRRTTSSEIDLNTVEALQSTISQRDQTIAVLTDREINTSRSLSDAEDLISTLRLESQKLHSDVGALSSTKETLADRLSQMQSERDELKSTLTSLRDEVTLAKTDIVRLQTDIEGKEERLSVQKRDFDEIKNNLEEQFRAIAGRILIDSSNSFTDKQTTKLDDLLKPFKEQIDGFKKDFDAKFTSEAMEKGSLKQQIESLVLLNNTIAKEALALTDALRGSTKKQGDWGEDILEKILEYSGLQKGIHYSVQRQSSNEDGKIIRPDVVVNYPDGRFLVIDAKVSLVHYWDYCNAGNSDEQKLLLPRIVASLKSHIDGLASKKYTDIVGTPEFIIMFMPVEPAYITAMQFDHGLWKYAYDRKILLISPTNLIPAMKMISVMWDKDQIQKDGETIVSKAVKLYEKFHGFIATFDGIGTDLEKANKKWQEGRGQLHAGRDNFITQGMKLKALLGKRTTKELPADIQAMAALEEENSFESNEKEKGDI